MYPLVPVGATNRDKRSAQPFVPVGGTNRDKRLHFCLGWCLQPGQKAHIPPLARLAVGPGTKATFCPGPKGSRDKWLGTKAYSVVVGGRNLAPLRSNSLGEKVGKNPRLFTVQAIIGTKGWSIVNNGVFF